MAHVVHAVSEGQIFASDLSLEVVTCPSCRIVYAIPQSLASSARAYPGGGRPNGWNICCPMGHEWHYTGKSVIEKLDEERRRSQAARDLLKAEERSHAATRGHLTRTKNRVSHGVCPCCNRTFQQLARHMEAKHPEFAPDREHGSLPHGPEPRRGEFRAVVDAVLAFVGDEVKTYTEITEAVGITNGITTGHASNVLHRMVKNGEVERVARGRYRRPQK